MHSRVVAVWGLAALAIVAAGSVTACGDDDDNSSSDAGGADASSDMATPDTGPAPDAGVDSGDSGPTVSVTTGSTAIIEVVGPDILFQASFYEDDTILRASNAPECVAFLRSGSKLRSTAGTLTAGGPTVGMDGGAPANIVIDMPTLTSTGYEYVYFGPIYPPGADTVVQFEKTATTAFPTLTVQSVKTPLTTAVAMTAPLLPDAGPLKIPSAQPFTVTWTPPAGAVPEHRLMIQILALAAGSSGGYRIGDLRCAPALSAGTATIPTSLLSALRVHLGGKASGYFSVEAGGRKEIVAGNATYLLEVKAIENTSLFNPTDVELD